MVRHTGSQITLKALDRGLWQGRRVRLVEGTTVTVARYTKTTYLQQSG